MVRDMVEIFIDGDACPVKAEVIKVAERHGIKINIASNAWLRLGEVGVEVNQVMVPKTPDAADNWIADNVKEGDVVITSDIPLASRCLLKKAYVLRPNGSDFTEDNIGMALGMRELHSFLRETEGKQTYNSGFTTQDRSAFLSRLETLVQKAKKLILPC